MSKLLYSLKSDKEAINKALKIDVEKAKEWILKWAQPSERVAKMLYNLTWDELFKKFFRYIESQRPKKREKEE